MIRLCTYYLLLLFVLFALQATAQRLPMELAVTDMPASEFLTVLSRESGINIIFSDHVVASLPNITLVGKAESIEEILRDILKDTGVTYRFSGSYIVLFASSDSSQRYTVSGIVADSISGEPIISALVYDEISGKGTLTNNYGFYSLQIPSGPIRLRAGYPGYFNTSKEVLLNQNRRLHLRLIPDGMLAEVVVRAGQRSTQDKESHPPVERITPIDMAKANHVGGAADIYRALDFVPGIQTGTDGFGGIQVRGGANDQNLILMDGVPVYHPNHLMGMVSVFNRSALHQASVYKASFPSRFSGRLSSVMDVRMREGNIFNWSVSGQASVSEFNLMAEGPLIREEAGIMLSGRYFLPGLVMRGITRNYKVSNGISGEADIDYIDFNGKVHFRLSDRDRIYFSMYSGYDRFFDLTITDRELQDPDSGMPIQVHEAFHKDLNWRNRTAVFRWNHLLGSHAFANVIISGSSFQLQTVDKNEFRYDFEAPGQDPVSGFDTREFKSGIDDITARFELDLRINADHELTAGAYGIRYQFKPKSITINEESKVGDFYLNEGLLDDVFFSTFRVKAAEAGVYLEDQWNIDPHWRLTAGMHIAGFFVQREYYLDPQLRIHLSWRTDSRFQVHAGYSRMVQYLHHLTSSGIGLPTDLWVPTTSRVSPSLSDQYAVTLLWNPNSSFSADVSAYMKDMRSLVSYQEGASFLLREGLLPSSIVDAANWENKVTSGHGDARGVEMRLAYGAGPVSVGAFGTLSRSMRVFEGINDNKPYPDRNDRRWTAGFSFEWQPRPRWTIGANWLYGSGMAITLAESKFFNPGTFFPETGISYSARNGFRLPAYHRLDLNLSYEFVSGARYSHSLAVNLYNVYNRLNPFYITLVHDPITQAFEFRQFSLFRFFPSLSYRFTLAGRGDYSDKKL